MKNIGVLLLIAILTLTAAGRGKGETAPELDLFTLEEQVLKSNPLIKDKELEIETLKLSLKNFKAENGGTFSVTASYYPDSDYSENIIGYKYGLSGTFKYPILGEGKNIKFKVGQLEALIKIKEAELEGLKAKLLFSLRKEYTSYYYSFNLEKEIDRTIRELEELEAKVRYRLSNQMALTVDLLSIDSLIAKLRAQKASVISDKLASLAKIKTLIADPYLKEFTPSSSFPKGMENIYFPPAIELFKFAEENRKDIELLREAYSSLYGAVKESSNAYPKGWISLTGSATSYDLDRVSSGIGVLLTFTFPRERGVALETLNRERELRALREKNRVDLEKTLILTDIQTALSNFKTYRDKYLALRKEYEAVSVDLETLRKRASAGLITGTDYLSKQAILLNRRVSTYLLMMNSYKNMVINYFLLLKSLGVREIPWLLRFRSNETDREEPGTNQPFTYAYVWKTDFLGKPEEEKAFIDELIRLRLNGIFLSLNGNQIERFLATERGRKELSSFIRKLRAQGVDIQLLLGENTWIYPNNRGKLLRIINLVNRYNREEPFSAFTAVHLDIEPHALPEWDTNKAHLSTLYIKTLKEVKFTANTRIYADIPYKFLKERIGGKNLAEEVFLTVDGVTLMAYTTNLIRLKELILDFKALANIYKRNAVVALSVEKSQPSWLSFFYLPKERFRRAVGLIGKLGVKYIAIQDFSCFREYYREEGQRRAEPIKSPKGEKEETLHLVFTGSLPKVVILEERE